MSDDPTPSSRTGETPRVPTEPTRRLEPAVLPKDPHTPIRASTGVWRIVAESDEDDHAPRDADHPGHPKEEVR